MFALNLCEFSNTFSHAESDCLCMRLYIYIWSNNDLIVDGLVRLTKSLVKFDFKWILYHIKK